MDGLFVCLLGCCVPMVEVGATTNHTCAVEGLWRVGECFVMKGAVSGVLLCRWGGAEGRKKGRLRWFAGGLCVGVSCGGNLSRNEKPERFF